MPSTISTAAQTIVVDSVGSLVLTPIEQDPITGEYVRELRSFEDSLTGTTSKMVMVCQFRSATRQGVEITTPNLQV